MYAYEIQSSMTMAEVAVFNSNGSDQAIAEPGKGTPPKESFVAERRLLGPCRRCTGLSFDERSADQGSASIAALRLSQGFYCLKEVIS